MRLIHWAKKHEGIQESQEINRNTVLGCNDLAFHLRQFDWMQRQMSEPNPFAPNTVKEVLSHGIFI